MSTITEHKCCSMQHWKRRDEFDEKHMETFVELNITLACVRHRLDVNLEQGLKIVLQSQKDTLE